MIDLAELKVYEFEEFRLDAKSHRLFRRESGELVPLTPKAIDLLLFLVQNKMRILTKDELLEVVWDNSFVEESNLSQTIFVLRKTLGENKKEPRFILTAPNRGYQFIATVSEINPDDKILEEGFLLDVNLSKDANPKPKIQNPTLLWLAIPLVLLFGLSIYFFYPTSKPATVREVKSIAILPFEDLSAEQTEKYLGVSLADALTNKFSSLNQLTVRPTRTVSKYVDSHEDAGKIGRELQVDAVLDGRIQRIGDRIRLSIQLIRSSDNTTIWTENFDDNFTNFFAVQDSISQKVVQSLALQLDDKEREKFNRQGTQNAQAYEEFLRGRFFWNKRTAADFERSIQHFQKALELDPNFAQAYSALAETYVLVNLFGTKHNPNAFPMAKAAAERALQLDNQLAEAHAALAQVKMQYDYNWAGTETEYLKAIELNPNNATVRQWYGEFLALQGSTDESLVQMEKAIEFDPTSLSTNNALALTLLRSHKSDEGLAVIEKVLEMDANFPWALHYQCRAFFQKADFEKAIGACRKALAVSNQSIFMKSNLASILARAGRASEARQILAELQQTAQTGYVSPYNFAMIYNSLGEKTATFKYLNQAIDEHDFLIPSLKGDTLFLNLHDDSQFKQILRRVNF